jgi:hypothetical protein
LEGRAETEKSLPPLPEHFTELCENGARFWPGGWKGEFGPFNYFYLAGFVEYLNNHLREINVSALQRRFGEVIEEATGSIPDHWIDWNPALLVADAGHQSREDRLKELTLATLGRRRLELLRDRKPVSFYTALLAVMCVRELMGQDPDEKRALHEVFQIRWAGYSILPWFGEFYADISDEHFDQLSGRTAHWNNRTIFDNIVAGYTITKPLAERIREYMMAIREKEGQPKRVLRIEPIHARARESQGTVAKLEKRAAEGEIVYLEWPESEDD